MQSRYGMTGNGMEAKPTQDNTTNYSTGNYGKSLDQLALSLQVILTSQT